MARRLDVGLIDGKDISMVGNYKYSIKLEAYIDVMDEQIKSLECGRIVFRARM